ncbi:hypothetical protein [Pseudoalteromonas sp. G4]|uniref:hypothetical protein n=1 Tax=Pseudoalteromonas sp. G4 TaxID=2992761 RepID=UPI00237DC663|nr:hypothetical protein [Pseudoalteromonas sp. G4]MDE3272063.1 hypothetical protein [Pseudoalteromonas sp. G4]
MFTLKNSFLSLCFVTSFASYSAIYKCEIDGVLTFSDQPCSDKYEKIEVNPQVIKKRPNANAKPNTDSTDTYVKSRQLKREIEQVKARIKKLQKDMDVEISAVKNMTVRTANNLYGASRSEALALEMNAITERYRGLIDVEQSNLARLQNELNKLNNSSATNQGDGNSHTQELNRIGSYVDMQKVERQIANNDAQIKRLQREMNEEVAALKKQSGNANTNLAGAKLQQSLAQEMAAVSKQYQIKINALQKESEILRSQKAKSSALKEPAYNGEGY